MESQDKIQNGGAKFDILFIEKWRTGGKSSRRDNARRISGDACRRRDLQSDDINHATRRNVS